MLKDTNIVEKSKVLVWAKFQDYGIGELKILDTYLSRINARDPESALVSFTKKEYADLMGIDPNIRTSQLKAYTAGLLRNVVTIDLPGEGYVQYPLFSKAECRYDNELGQVLIKIRCHEELKPAFFALAKNGYVQSQLKNVLALNSPLSIRLYTMLKAMPFGWTIKVEDLREKLGAMSPTYNEFKRFNTMVLKKAIKEINDITDINVTAENIRRGRSVVSIKFTVEEKKQLLLGENDVECYDAIDDQCEIEGFIEEFEMEAYEHDDPLAICAAALPSDLTKDQVKLLRDLALDHLPFETQSMAERDLWLHDYLQRKTLLMKATPNVISPFAWLKQAVAENWE